MVHRNLALAYAQHEYDVPKAIASLEKAVELDPNEPRYFYELDRLYEAGGAPVAKRLDMLARHHDVVAKRDDALTREIVLLTVAGLSDTAKLDRAVELLTTHRFHNWEGRSEIHGIYADALLARGQKRMREKKFADALQDFTTALEYPANLEVGRPRSDSNEPEIRYHLGLAYEAMDQKEQARQQFELAAGSSNRGNRRGRGRGDSESSFYQARALQKLDRESDAQSMFEALVKAGEAQLTRGETADYFAKFGEKQSERVRQANSHYLIGLGLLGQGKAAEAKKQFAKVLELHPAHLGAAVFRRQESVNSNQ